MHLDRVELIRTKIDAPFQGVLVQLPDLRAAVAVPTADNRERAEPRSMEGIGEHRRHVSRPVAETVRGVGSCSPGHSSVGPGQARRAPRIRSDIRHVSNGDGRSLRGRALVRGTEPRRRVSALPGFDPYRRRRRRRRSASPLPRPSPAGDTAPYAPNRTPSAVPHRHACSHVIDNVRPAPHPTSQRTLDRRTGCPTTSRPIAERRPTSRTEAAGTSPAHVSLDLPSFDRAERHPSRLPRATSPAVGLAARLPASVASSVRTA